MKIELLIALIGILGTVTVSFIGTLFAYLTHKNEFAQFVKKIRVERTFQAYEKLLELVIMAQITQLHNKDGKKLSMSSVLMEKENFKTWYPEFHKAWHTKQYLLDSDSMNTCKVVADFITKVIKKYPTFGGGEAIQHSATEEEFFDLHSRFLSILESAHESLKKFLNSGIEKE